MKAEPSAQRPDRAWCPSLDRPRPSRGADGGYDLVGAEGSARGECHSYFVGTRRFNSSSKCWTTTIRGGALVAPFPAALIIRNRWPSAATS